MYCSKCGNKLNDTSLFCSSCGAKVSAIASEPVQPVNSCPVMPQENIKTEKNHVSAVSAPQSHSTHGFELISGLFAAITAILVSISLMVGSYDYAYFTTTAIAAAVFSATMLILKHKRKNPDDSQDIKYTVLSMAVSPLSALSYYIFFFLGAGMNFANGFLFLIMFAAGLLGISAYTTMKKAEKNSGKDLLGVFLALSSFILTFTVFFSSMRFLGHMYDQFEIISLFLYVLFQTIFSLCILLPPVISHIKDVAHSNKATEIFKAPRSIAGYSVLAVVLAIVIIISSAFTFMGTNLVSRNARSYDLRGYNVYTPLNHLYIIPNDLSALSKLEYLDLTDAEMTRGLYKNICKCTQLKTLILPFTDYIIDSRLGNLKNLEWLVIFDIHLSDASFLSEMENLKHLEISSRNISDFSFLAEMENLRYFEIHYSPLRDLSGITDCTNLETLWINGTKHIIDLDGIDRLTNLRRLYLTDCKVSDIMEVAALQDLEYLSISEQTLGYYTLEELEDAMPNCTIRIDD